MWDVIWTDPNRELVGEHRARKERKREQQRCEREKDTNKEGSKGKSQSARNSISSAICSGESPFSFLKAQGLKHSNTTRTKSSVSSALGSLSIQSMRLQLSPTFDARSHRSSGLAATGDSSTHSRPSIGSKGKQNAGGSDEQACGSESSPRPLLYPDSSSSNFASLDLRDPFAGMDTSSLTRSDPSQIAPRTPSPCPEGYSRDVSVHYDSRDSREPGEGGRCSEGSRSQSLVLKVASELDQLEGVHGGHGLSLLPSPDPRSSLSNLSPKSSIAFNAHEPEDWQTPEEWESREAEASTNVSGPSVRHIAEKSLAWSIPNPKEDRGDNNNCKDTCEADRPPSTCPREVSFDLESMVVEVQNMALSDPQANLRRLQKLNKMATGLEDESRKPWLEFEQNRWMMSTLHHLDQCPDQEISRLTNSKIPLVEAHRILVLYESSSTAAYLAALHHDKAIYHLSPNPLSPAYFSNTQQLLVPEVSPSIFPVSPDCFDTVYSISLSSLCAQHDIPGILKNVNECLHVGGTLHLTVVDPLPCEGTLGRHLRTWLETHLLDNLVKESRCTNPSWRLPQWLGEASLRAKGSTRTTTKFFAMPISARSHGAGNGGRYGPGPSSLAVGDWSEYRTKAQLRSLVGRMLWMEVWGSYITADTWWWDDQACVEECIRLGTFWEYHLIEGVKGA